MSIGSSLYAKQPVNMFFIYLYDSRISNYQDPRFINRTLRHSEINSSLPKVAKQGCPILESVFSAITPNWPCCYSPVSPTGWPYSETPMHTDEYRMLHLKIYVFL